MIKDSVIFSRRVIISLVVFVPLLIPAISQAQEVGQCSFTRTLEDGMEGEDVRCLQQHLNANGFKIADTGPGSPGKETTLFRTLTKQAIVGWQTAKGVVPASGVFGPQSQSAYLSDLTNVPQSQNSSEEILANLINELIPEPQVAGAMTSVDYEDESVDNAESRIIDTMKMVLTAKKEISKLQETDTEEAGELEDDLYEVLKNILGSLRLYFDQDYSEAEELARETLDDVIDVYEDAGGESPKREAENILDDLEDLYEEVSELLSEAEDDDAKVGEAPELIEEAEELLDQARESFDDKVYRQAISYALDAEELLEEAKDEIDIISNDDVEEYVEEVRDAYEEAVDEIAEAEDDGEKIDDAEDLLSDAKRQLKKADIALDDGDYDEALEYAEKAEELIEEALDEI